MHEALRSYFHTLRLILLQSGQIRRDKKQGKERKERQTQDRSLKTIPAARFHLAVAATLFGSAIVCAGILQQLASMHPPVRPRLVDVGWLTRAHHFSTNGLRHWTPCCMYKRGALAHASWASKHTPVVHAVAGVVGIGRVGTGVEARVRFAHELRPHHRGWIQWHARLRQQHKALIARIHQCCPQQDQLRLHLQQWRALSSTAARRSLTAEQRAGCASPAVRPAAGSDLFPPTGWNFSRLCVGLWYLLLPDGSTKRCLCGSSIYNNPPTTKRQPSTSRTPYLHAAEHCNSLCAQAHPTTLTSYDGPQEGPVAHRNFRLPVNSKTCVLGGKFLYAVYLAWTGSATQHGTCGKAKAAWLTTDH